MFKFKYWTNGIVSRLDHMTARVEDPEILLDKAIVHIKRSGGQAKARMIRVTRDGDQMNSQLNRDQEQILKWRNRAQSCGHEGDEVRALECLRRSKAAAGRANALSDRLSEHLEAQNKLSVEIKRLEEQLVALIERRNLMRTRQSKADASQAIQKAGSQGFDGVDAIFERWEARICEAEYGFASPEPADHFEDAFASQEEENDLKKELVDLMAIQ